MNVVTALTIGLLVIVLVGREMLRARIPESTRLSRAAVLVAWFLSGVVAVLFARQFISLLE